MNRLALNAALCRELQHIQAPAIISQEKKPPAVDCRRTTIIGIKKYGTQPEKPRQHTQSNTSRKTGDTTVT